MKNPHQSYQHNIKQQQLRLQKLKQRLRASSLLRLGIFLASAGLIYYFFDQTALIGGIALGGITLFMILVTRHNRLKYQKKEAQTLINLNETELLVLNRNFSMLPSGDEFRNAQHEFSQDIDLFGERSFFQYLNRTALVSGKERLASLLTANETQGIPKRQQAIGELAQKVDFRQLFTATATLVDAETAPKTILNWLSSYKAFTPKRHAWLPKVFSAISLVLIISYFLGFVSGYYPSAWFLIGLGISGRYLKNVNQLSQQVSKAQDTFQQYHRLLALLEKEDFESELLKNQQQKITTANQEASRLLHQFSRSIDSLDQRNNLLFGIFGNGFLLWDLHYAHQLEQWMQQHQHHVAEWFAVIEWMDAYNSLANFRYNHPDYQFPNITDTETVLAAEESVHPLIHPKDAVTNSFSIARESFFIITGANMAGKSTFLRTVSLLIVMGNVGLPVCAASCSYTPIKLITSMRTVDSLADEASYFYSELSRLKFIIDRIQQENYFIILDEILKGTNSVDKAKGSQKFIEKLVKSKSTGIIATHDLSLCKVADDYPQVTNYYFDATIANDELYFDYQFKKGICQNMNASFLLRKMQIVDA